MNARPDIKNQKISLEFDDRGELLAFLDKAREENGFVLQLEERLKLHQQLTFEMTQDAASVELRGEVIQVFQSGSQNYGTAFQVLDWDPVKKLETSEKRDSPPTDTADSEMGGSSPVFQIKKMNVSQKMRLAAKASRTERQILLRDNSPQVLMGLLGNPRIEDKEVLELVKSPYASSGVLQRVAKDRRWFGKYEIRLALVRNPKMPPVQALRLVETLRTRDLQILAKGSDVRDAIKNAALRLYLKRR